MLSLTATPARRVPTLKQQLAAVKAKVAKLQSQLKKAKAQHRKDATTTGDAVRLHRMDAITLGQRDNQIVELQTQITERTTAGVATVLAGSPQDIYSAVQQIWDAFPLRPGGQTCGYDKSGQVTIDFPVLKSSTYTFSFQQCPA